jgi:hypothetical protein
MANPIARFFAHRLLERPAARIGVDGLVERLEAGRGPLAALAEAAEDATGRKQLRHVIAIERWGQNRLRVALGDVAFARDESRGYAPPEDEPVARLVERFDAVRAETVALGRRIAAADAGATPVEHNSLGPISARAWLRYLQVHGELEMKRARPRR